jgi:hypothetical protein
MADALEHSERLFHPFFHGWLTSFAMDEMEQDQLVKLNWTNRRMH